VSSDPDAIKAVEAHGRSAMRPNDMVLEFMVDRIKAGRIKKRGGCALYCYRGCEEGGNSM
jgi:hypothetical protein